MPELTKDELYEKAKKLKIKGRSKMDKDELEAAIAKVVPSRGPVVPDRKDRKAPPGGGYS